MAKPKTLPAADDGREIRLPDGFRIVRMLPGFRVFKGDNLIAGVAYWTEAVAVVKVEREAARVG